MASETAPTLGNAENLIFDLTVESRQTIDGVSGAGGIEVEDVAIGGLDAEVLMLEVAESPRHEDGAGEENHG